MTITTISKTAANPHQPPNQTKASTMGIAITAVSHLWPTDCPCLLALTGLFVCGFSPVARCTRPILPARQRREERRCDQNVVVVDSNYLMLDANLLVQNQAIRSGSHNIHYKPTATGESC